MVPASVNVEQNYFGMYENDKKKIQGKLALVKEILCYRFCDIEKLNVLLILSHLSLASQQGLKPAL